MKGLQLIKSALVIAGCMACIATTAQASGFYLLPTITANLPASTFPISATGCTSTLQSFTSSSGAQLCEFTSPATITLNSLATGGGACQLNVTGTTNTFSIASATCTYLNTNPTNPTPTVLIQGGFSQNGGGGSGGANQRSITIINNTSKDPITVYMGVNNGATALQNLQTCYTITPATTFGAGTNPPEVAQFSVSKSSPLTITFTQTPGAPGYCTSSTLTILPGQLSLAFTTDNIPWGPCPTSLAEFTLHGLDGSNAGDTADVSLVNGINHLISIAGNNSGTTVNMDGAQSPYNTIPGVYPLGCTNCTSSQNPPPWSGCPVAPFQCQATANCQKTGVTGNTSYTVTFSDLQ